MMSKERELKEKLTVAENELQQWFDYDYRRTDGSQRQDAIHEKRGRELQRKVDDLKLKLATPEQ